MTEHLPSIRRLATEPTELAHAVLDAVPDPIFVVDLDGHVLLRNLAHKRLLARLGLTPTRAELAIDELATLVDDPRRLYAFFRRNIDDPEQGHVEEFVMPRAGGAISVRTAPVRGSNGSVIARIVVLGDLTAERRWREELVLEARTPLTAIAGFAELLAERDDDEATRRDYFRHIVAESKRLDRALTKLYAGYQPEATPG